MGIKKRIGPQTVRFSSPPAVLSCACAAGVKECQGPLGKCVDVPCEDDLLGQDSWEKAESQLQRYALDAVLRKAGAEADSLDVIFAGDLLNQCIGSSFGLRDAGAPFYGLYGACSTMSESLSLAAMSIDGGFAKRAMAITSSHYCSAERQFRLPIDYGAQRAPTAQWTVTGSGAVLLEKKKPRPAASGVHITHVTTGKIIDAGITDSSNMGAAMAPAAYDTLSAFFNESGLGPEKHDLIVTGDLGAVGMQIVRDLFLDDGVDLGKRYNDCGVMVFDLDKQDVHAGGSGCGCSAVVLCGHIINEMRAGTWKNVLFCGTGALLSQVSSLQGDSIPGICHLVRFSSEVM
ncbi:MAG: stage V sporulation protein AD [Oscillospiraceae bacterium]|jgi:stage V sporulation protein AD|nr:stage V sporulation protein AD [Oscillospiraceae bacterium]